jgi:hypothetical protein
MHFAYVDEHENEKNGLKYTSATAAVYSSACLVPFRRDLVFGMSDLLFGTGRNPRTVDRLPVLHACDLPRGLDDEKKLSLFKLVVDLSLRYEVRFVRAGYFDYSIATLAPSREERIDFCLFNCLWPIQSFLHDEVMYEYELHYSAHRKFRSYNDAYTQELSWQSEAVRESVSIENYGNIVGKLYCDKHNHHMYPADFIGYALSQRDKSGPTPFQQRIVECLAPIEKLILYDDIIAMRFDGAPQEGQ